MDDRSYEEYINKYVYQVKAFIKNEKVRNSVTNKYEDCDMYFIEEFEKNISLKEKPDEFRSHLISRLGAFSIDHPGEEIVMSKVYPDIIKSLKESFRNEQQNVIKSISQNLTLYASNPESLPQKDKLQIDTIIKNLCDLYNYKLEGAIEMIKYIIKKHY